MKINNYYENNKVVKRKKYMTKKRVLAKKRKKALKTLLTIILSVALGIFLEAKNSFVIQDSIVSSKEVAPLILSPQRQEAVVKIPPVEKVIYREFTAYNAGDPYQCDDTPCISASLDNICELLAQGQVIFASNEFPLGTKLYVEGIGEGIVLDRMNSRFKTRIDVAMQAHEKPRAIAFGLQTLKIKILK